jgi:hypothetical protein
MGIQHVWEESNFVPGTNLRVGGSKGSRRIGQRFLADSMGARKEAPRSQ